MKVSSTATSSRSAWQNNRPFLVFLAVLLLLHSVLKILFYGYNHSLLFAAGSGSGGWLLVKWSLVSDLLCLLAINTVFLFLLQLARITRSRLAAQLICILFSIVNTGALLLNVLDVFYYRFRFQRASADLLYVINHPFGQLFHFSIPVIIAFTIAMALLAFGLWKLHRWLCRHFAEGSNHQVVTLGLLTCLVAAFFFRNQFSRILLPAYPLTELTSNELPVVQNSANTFLYSVIRGGDEVFPHQYMTDAECDSLFPVRKKIIAADSSGKRNVVLFIMESVAYDFFDSSSRFKVAMPFFDSLMDRSTFFTNAFCYSHESNKGITALLSGLPTLTDIPLYHSPYVNIPHTPIGQALGKRGYQSLFCIGDGYDNFGFAKCMRWLGVDDYYSEEAIPGYQQLPQHSMGLQDEAVLPFFLSKIRETKKPFLAIHYNISTHYPYDLSPAYRPNFPAAYTEPMRSMQYYDHCLQTFFARAKNEPWFSNTVFLFCSDHWMFPEGIEGKYDPVTGYRIPILLYDPSKAVKEVRDGVVSQFDIPGTVLSLAGYADSLISYGGNLLDPASLNGFAFAKSGSSLYQVTDSNYVLGFNTGNNTVEYLYNHQTDARRKNNLAQNNNASPVRDALLRELKAFIQKAGAHYKGKPVK
ncbi:MAG: sulfatase-like hydrolase/transferase [Ferruginibacter sp.]